MDSRSLGSQMGEVYIDVHEHIENRSDNEDARRHLIFELVLTVMKISYLVLYIFITVFFRGLLP